MGQAAHRGKLYLLCQFFFSFLLKRSLYFLEFLLFEYEASNLHIFCVPLFFFIVSRGFNWQQEIAMPKYSLAFPYHIGVCTNRNNYLTTIHLFLFL